VAVAVAVAVADGRALCDGIGDAVTVVAGVPSVPVGVGLGDSLTWLVVSPASHAHAIDRAIAVPAAAAMRSRRGATTGIAITARLAQTP
jgi:hypothetical protein